MEDRTLFLKRIVYRQNIGKLKNTLLAAAAPYRVD
jgi:hypothetical protein